MYSLHIRYVNIEFIKIFSLWITPPEKDKLAP